MDKASDLLIWQYRGKEKAVATVNALADEASRVYASALQLLRILNIDDAEKYELDLVGMHVGQSRLMPEFVAKDFFGFDNIDGANPFNQGEWYRVGGQLLDPLLMSDIEYRWMIKARITKNFQIGTLDDIIDAVQYLFGSNANAVDGLDMSVATIILPAAQLSALQLYAIRKMDIIPRPVGVKYSFLQVDAIQPFGWYADPLATGFNIGVFSRFLT